MFTPRYSVADGTNVSSKRIQEEINQWSAVAFASDHLWNPPAHNAAFVPDIILYPMVDMQDTAQPSKLLVWSNAYNLLDWGAHNNKLMPLEPLNMKIISKLDKLWIFQELLAVLEKTDSATLSYFHLLGYDCYKKNVGWDFNVSTFADLVSEYYDLTKLIIYHTIEYIKKTYSKDWKSVLYNAIIYKHINNCWVINKLFNYQAMHVDKDFHDSEALTNKCLYTIRHIKQASLWQKVYNKEWLFFSGSYTVFLYDLLKCIKHNTNKVYHFSSPIHYLEGRNWTHQNNLFNGIYEYLLEKLPSLPNYIESNVVSSSLTNRINVIHPKWTLEEYEEYSMYMSQLFEDYLEHYSDRRPYNSPIALSIVTTIRKILARDLRKNALGWQSTVIDYIAKSRSELQYYLTWHDTALWLSKNWLKSISEVPKLDDQVIFQESSYHQRNDFTRKFSKSII